MRYERVSNAPYTGTIRARDRATNADLVRDVTDAARTAAGKLEWPANIPPEDAAEAMHAFTRAAVHYEAEDGDQLIRMPWRTIADGTGDCKSTAVLIASMCRAAGRDARLRFVRYDGEDWFGHVYAVVDGTPVDPQLQFGEEVIHSHHTDRTL